MSLFEDASLIVTPNGFKAGKLYSIKPTNGDGDLNVVRATTATRVNSAGLIETVANNVPRLDYTNGSCPSILVEPQRTNLALYSEQFDSASYNVSLRNGSIVVDSLISPDGNLTADNYVENNTTKIRAIFQNTGVTSGTIYNLSVFAKNNGRILQLSGTTAGFGTNFFANFDLNDGTIGTVGSSATAQIENYGNGWYRCSIRITATSTTAAGGGLVILSNSKTSGRIPSYLGDGVSGVYLWGFQLEAGANATSYIPTVSSAVTRNADVISKTGISDLIGQTEGTLFAEIDWNSRKEPLPRIILALEQSGTNNAVRIGFGGTNQLRIGALSINGANIVFSQAALGQFPDGLTKIAAAYDSNGIQLFVNGTALLLGALTGSYAPLNAVAVGNRNNDQFFDDRINQALVFKTRLTNAQLEALTTL